MARDRDLFIGFSLTATWNRKGEPEGAAEFSPEEDGSDFYVGIAKRAEQAQLDFVFKPDTLFYNPGMARGAPARGPFGIDPTIMLTAIARETRKIGLVTTASTTFNPPYVIARQLQSLHWISQGRAGWNIVTSIEGAGNFGNAPMPSSEERYRKAAEFTDLVRALWDSHPGAASGDDGPARAPKPVNHVGEFFHVDGPLNVPAHPAGPMPLFQAGASDVGREFAASVADAIFAATPDAAAGIELCADLRRRAEGRGRPADAVRVLPGLHFFLGRTREEAQALHRETHAHIGLEQRLSSLHSAVGLDLTGVPPDTKVTPDMLPASDQPVRSRTHADLLRTYIAREEPTVSELLERPEVIASAHWVSVGTVEDVVDDIITWHDAKAMDGFIALPGGNFRCVEMFFDELMPMLVEKGRFRKAYTGSTLKEHLGLV